MPLFLHKLAAILYAEDQISVKGKIFTTPHHCVMCRRYYLQGALRNPSSSRAILSYRTATSSWAMRPHNRARLARLTWKVRISFGEKAFQIKKTLDKETIGYYSIIMKLSNYTKIFKALSNEQRLKIFMMLYKNCCVPEGSKVMSEFRIKGESCCAVRGGLEKAFTKICDCMDLSRSTISHHFKELQNAGLITCEREGQLYRCRVNNEAVESIKRFLE